MYKVFHLKRTDIGKNRGGRPIVIFDSGGYITLHKLSEIYKNFDIYNTGNSDKILLKNNEMELGSVYTKRITASGYFNKIPKIGGRPLWIS